MKKYTIAVVGALGNVGTEMCNILEKSELPIGNLVLMDVAQNAGKKVYELFVKRGPQYHARYPGAMIEGMVWFELLYLDKLKKISKKYTPLIR